MNQLDSLLEELSHTRGALLGAIAGLDAAALDRKGVVGSWSIKNTLAHIAAWEDRVAHTLPIRLATGDLPEELRAEVADEDAWNARQTAEREELTPDEQLIELERTRAALVDFLRTLDPALLDRPNPWQRWSGTLTEFLRLAIRDHEAEHLEDLHAAAQALRAGA